MRGAYSFFMTNTNKAQRLTNRSGRTMWAVVTYHAPIHAEGRAVCGMTFESIGAQDFRTNQTSICGANSDVNCKGCLAGMGQELKAKIEAKRAARNAELSGPWHMDRDGNAMLGFVALSNMVSKLGELRARWRAAV